MSPGWTIVQWVALAALSGVIGNVAYDAVLRAAKSVKRPGGTEHEPRTRPINVDIAVLIAELATAVRARDIGWADPGRHSRHQAECDESGQWTVHLSYEQKALESVVVLPAMVAHPESISVLLRKKT
ncbi:hypothetical protein ACLQ26_23115 [Micromonospora sp. DT43]|uniref:hypothetical protein n=1 Tax=Micromonospora sp. DT43 TaxID=3393440 RepID=UPI003CEBA435